MSGLAVAALVSVCAWLGILTLVVVLLVRQIGLLTVRLSVASQALSVDDDGPEVGDAVPEEVAAVLPDGQAYLLLVSAGCSPCRDLVADLAGRRIEQNVVALVPGNEEQADQLLALLPPGVRAVPDPGATELAGLLNLHSTPFVLEVAEGTVTGKAYLHEGAADFLEFIGAEDPSEEPTTNLVKIADKKATKGR